MLVAEHSTSMGVTSRSFWIGRMYTLDRPTRSCVARGDCNALGAQHSKLRLLGQQRISSNPPDSRSLGNASHRVFRYSSAQQSIFGKKIFFSPSPASSNISRSHPAVGTFNWLQLAKHVKQWVHDVWVCLRFGACALLHSSRGRLPFLLEYEAKLWRCSWAISFLMFCKLFKALTAFSWRSAASAYINMRMYGMLGTEIT